jgi:hypothetical protein
MHETLAGFEEVWSFDFEFLGGDVGEHYDVVCLAARELRSGRTLRLWRDELLQLGRRRRRDSAAARVAGN